VIPNADLNLDVYALDPTPGDTIKTLEIYRNGALFFSTPVNNSHLNLRFSLPTPEEPGKTWWYYVKAVQSDGDLAYTSPIWVYKWNGECVAKLNDAPLLYTTVQQAVDASTHPTDVVKVAGTCATVQARGETMQVLHISKTLTVRGGYSVDDWQVSNPLSYPTVLDARGRGRVLYITGTVQAGTVAPVIENLRIEGGEAMGDDWAGGGLYVHNAQPTLRNTWIYSNAADYGGGLALFNSNALLVNTMIAANRAITAGSGGYIAGSSPLFLHTTLAENSPVDASGAGSGIYVAGDAGRLADCSSPTQSERTSNPQLLNTIVSSHNVGIYVAEGQAASLGYTLWHGNTRDVGGAGEIARTHDITGSPEFVNPESGDYHIGPASAACDAGTDVGIATDIDGEVRPVGFGYDLGADEFSIPALLVAQQASPDPVEAGGRLTYTLWVTNIGGVDLHATVIDWLPQQVSTTPSQAGTVVLPDGRLVWTPVVSAPQGVWKQQVIVTVALTYDAASMKVGYAGPLTNVLAVTTLEGPNATVTQTTRAVLEYARPVYLPLIRRE